MSDNPNGSKRLYYDVAQSILQSITAGRVLPGGRLPSEAELGKQYGVSRVTVREALLALEMVGAVQIRHGKGVYARGPEGNVTNAEGFAGRDILPYELIEARLEIEPSSAAMAALKISPETIGLLRSEMSQAEALSDDNEQLKTFVAINFRFHQVLALECGNRLVAHIVSDMVNTEAQPLWSLINQQASRTRAARHAQLHEHREILDALEAGNAEKARSAMRSHLQSIARAILT
jgi:Transcriptional regulators